MNTFAEIGELINKCNFICIIGHDKIDGDAMGSILGLGITLKKLGKSVNIFAPSNETNYLKFIREGKNIKTEFDYKNYDLIIICDCAEPKMIKKFWDKNEEYFKKSNILVLDHHVQTNSFGNYDFVDTTYSSCCEIVLDLIETNWKESIDSKIASLLFLGLTTDTNNFVNTNVTPNTFLNGKKLLEYGAKREMILEKLYNNKSFKSIEANSVVLLRTKKMKHFLYTYFSKQELEKMGVSKDEMGDSKEYIRQIKDKKMSIVFYIDGSNINGSIRSKNHKAQLVASSLFGGGGHTNASGFNVNIENDPIEEIRLITEKIDKFLDNNH
ncbi:MAG: bifunctional oligoribonuclease/PAP phosphatase NrnA [Candidatus Absconditabacteria bacterium]